MRTYPSLPPLLPGAGISPAEWPARRAQLLDALAKGMYGVSPAPCPARLEVLHESDATFGSKALMKALRVELEGPLGKGSFPVLLYIPKEKPTGLVIALSHMVGSFPFVFSGAPAEEIVDTGFALALIDYTAVSSDDDDFSTGIAPLFPRDPATGWGKLGIWGYAVSRFLDCVPAIGEVAHLPACVTGYSRLGKAALWCGAQDERIALTWAGGSGTGGVAISRANPRESFDDIVRKFPYWFCGDCAGYSGREEELPFDQHFALAAVAPRRAYVCCDEDDAWSDPYAEFDSCRLASGAYAALGLRGLVAPERDPVAGDVFHEGEIGYHIRPGTHAMTRQDWRLGLEYMKKIWG